MSEMKTVLLVDNDAPTPRGEATLLHQAGYNVIQAFTGEQAIETLAAWLAQPDSTASIDVGLIAINLGPGMDGVATAQAILEIHDLPIVFLTSHAEPGMVAISEQVTAYGYVDKDSGAAVQLASISLAIKLHAASQERRRVEQELRQFKAIVDSSTEAIAISDQRGQLLYTNPAHQRLFGRSLEEARRQTFYRYYTPESLEVLKSVAMPALLRGESWEGELEVVDAQGRRFPIWERTDAVRDESGAIQYAFGLMHEISQQVKAAAELRESEARYRRLVEGLPGIAYVFSTRRGGIFYSPGAEQILGYAVEHLYANPFLWNQSIHPQDWPRVQEAIEQCANGRPFDLTYRIRDAHGEWRWLLDRSVGQRVEATETLIEGLATDITANKHAEAALQRSVDEKELLLKELQHRVKNSLGMAASLLSLEMENLPDEHSRQVFADTRARMQTIGAVYDRLYQQPGLVAIALEPYFRDLGERLAGSYLPADSPVTIETHADGLTLDVKRTLALGLILNELVTNAIKYAFPDGRAGSIRVEMSATTDQARLTVTDNGIGASATPVSGLGLKLVALLAEQLEGNFTFESNSSGVIATVTIPLKPAPPHPAPDGGPAVNQAAEGDPIP